MRNADVEEGRDYAWSSSTPRPGDPLAKVRAMHPALTSGHHRIMGRMIEFQEDYEPRWGAMVPKGTLRVVPAREILGPWEEHAEKEEANATARSEGLRLAEEIRESLAALGIEGVNVSAFVAMEDVKLTIQAYGAARAQGISDALSFAVAGRG